MSDTALEKRSIRHRVFINLDTGSWPKSGLSPANVVVAILVIVSVLSAILETEETLANQYAELFWSMNKIFLIVFTIEYALRVWSMGEADDFRGIKGRFRYMVTPMAIIDLAAIAPFWLGAGSEVLLMRVFRVLRILKLARIPGVSKAMRNILAAVSLRKFELMISVVLAGTLMLMAASCLYLIEREVQPETFGSIPRALWWGMATLTTVGYGDVYPVSTLGRVAAGFFAFSGISLVAMPSGILAAALRDVYHDQRTSRDDPDNRP